MGVEQTAPNSDSRELNFDPHSEVMKITVKLTRNTNKTSSP